MQDKRMAIAKDVLMRLDKKQYIPTPMLYAHLNKGGDVQKSLRSSSTVCRVCAIGAIICSLAAKEDRIKAVSSVDSDTYIVPKHMVIARIRQIFGNQLTNTIESAFEVWIPHSMSDDPTERLRTIFTQIANTGTFEPSLV